MRMPENFIQDFNYMLNIIKGMEITSIIEITRNPSNSIDRLTIEIQEEIYNWEELLVKLFTLGYGYMDDFKIFQSLLATKKVDSYIIRYMNLHGFSSTMVCELALQDKFIEYIKGTGFVINYDKEG